MEIAMGILSLLVVLFGGGMCMAFYDRMHQQIKDLEYQVNGLSSRINEVANEAKISHAQLVDDLWRRGSEEIDQEIERARARGRGF
jgi:hypothetical protein